jgi:hypothetical protein
VTMLAAPFDFAEANRTSLEELADWLFQRAERGVSLETYVVTGSRVWRDWRLIHVVLSRLPWTAVQFNGLADGADGLCRMFWDAVAGQDRIRPFPARWETGRGAGHARNTLMMEHMPQLCLGFLAHDGPSRGTRDALAKAADRGIPTFVFHQAPRHRVNGRVNTQLGGSP